MSTVVTYNGVTLENVTTREFSAEVQYDPSGTCYVGTRYRCVYDCLVHTVGQAAHGVFTGNGQVRGQTADQWRAALSALRVPGKDLTITVAGRVLLSAVGARRATANSSARDVAQGPKPREAKINHVASSKAFRITFSIETTLYECPNGPPPAILSHRWSITESMDENWFTTRVIRGQMTFSAPQIEPGHKFRADMPLDLEQGFRRVSVEFTVSADGLSGEYTITDRQVANSAPYPATKMSGTHQEGTSDGVTFSSMLSVRLEGPPHEDKGFLVQRLLQIADNRLNYVALTGNPAGKPSSAILLQATITDHFGEGSAVELTMHLQHVSKLAFPQNVPARFTKPINLPRLVANGASVGKDHNSKISFAPDPFGYGILSGARPTAFLFALHCGGCEDICSAAAPAKPGDTGTTRALQGPITTPGGTTISGAVTSALGLIPFGGTALSGQVYTTAHEAAMYLIYKAESKYVLAANRCHLPIARTVGRSTASSSVVLGVARETAQRIITIEAERVGKPPEFPPPLDGYKDGSLRGKLLEHKVTAQPPRPTPDGVNLIHYARAIYVYALNRPPSSAERVELGKLPFVILTPDQQRIDPDALYSLK